MRKWMLQPVRHCESGAPVMRRWMLQPVRHSNSGALAANICPGSPRLVQAGGQVRGPGR